MSKLDQVLQIDPAHELHFKGPFTEVVSSTINLHNPTDKKVCFKVKTTAPKKYCVRPNSGIVEPQDTVSVAAFDPKLKTSGVEEMTQLDFWIGNLIALDDAIWQLVHDHSSYLNETEKLSLYQSDLNKLCWRLTIYKYIDRRDIKLERFSSSKSKGIPNIMALKQQLDEIDGKLRLLNFTTKKTDDILKTNDEEVAIRQKGQITKIILAISDLKQLIEEKKFIEGDSEENVAAWGESIEENIALADEK
ncbi:vesicle-associated membrane -associated B-like, partial [Paramuricea clavata]